MVTAPVANINGSSLERLIEQNYEAFSALDRAIEALASAAPHGRDFQTCAPEVFRTARREYAERLVLLGRVKREIAEIVEQLVEQRK